MKNLKKILLIIILFFCSIEICLAQEKEWDGYYNDPDSQPFTETKDYIIAVGTKDKLIEIKAKQIIKALNNNKGIRFIYVRVIGDMLYKNKEIKKNIYFIKTIFKNKVDFSDSKFSKKADFSYSKFSEQADFRNSKFLGQAYFFDSKFSEQADFRNSKFLKEAYFSESTFSKTTDFQNTQFEKTVDFSSVIFPKSEKINFSGTEFLKIFIDWFPYNKSNGLKGRVNITKLFY